MELRLGLEIFNVLEIYGYWRIVDVKIMDLVLSMFLYNVVLSDWLLDVLFENEVVSVVEIDGFLFEIVVYCLRVYGNKVDGGGGGLFWKLDER